jgi:hypothetical protein
MVAPGNKRIEEQHATSRNKKIEEEPPPGRDDHATTR